MAGHPRPLIGPLHSSKPFTCLRTSTQRNRNQLFAGRSTTSGLKTAARSSRFHVVMFSTLGDVSTRRRCIRRWRAWIPPSASFSRAASALLICLMSPSHPKHGNIWRQDNTLKAFCSSLIAHGSAPTISHLPPYRLAFIAQA